MDKKESTLANMFSKTPKNEENKGFFNLKDILSPKKMERVGYDFDGVADHLKLPENAVIITGRPQEDEAELRKTVGKRQIFFWRQKEMDYDIPKKELWTKIANFKVKIIKQMGITKFYEDTPLEVEILKRELPDVEIVQVDNGVDNGKQKIKPVSEVTACVFDYGTFISLADKMSETYKKVYYYTPTSQEFYSIKDLMKAEGMKKVERTNDVFDPKIFDTIDLFIFPDIGYGGLQKYLRTVGKAVWGSMGGDELETYRTLFLNTVKSMELPMIHTETVKGLKNLREHLKGVENKWIKVNLFRGNMETWHHIDIEHSEPQLNKLAVEFGGMQEHVTFVVQDYIKSQVEIGYDGWTVDGEFPESSFQGYEKKNELYLGSLKKRKDLPKEVKLINEAMSPLLKKMKYRNFIATEIRVADGVPYFIDPTMRMPGQTGEQMLETCTNLADVIWQGANGKLIKPEFKYEFAAEATMHYKTEGDWSILKIPEKIRQWFKLYHYCESGGFFHFPPKENDEVGVVLGVGDSIEKAIDDLKGHLKAIKKEPVDCDTEGFLDIIESIKEAEKNGIHFTSKKIPDPKSVI